MIKKIAIATAATLAAPLLAGPVLAGLGYRAVRRRQAARRLAITTPNGIDEQLFITVGGGEQWINIRGEDRDNPVLLVVHGGPGSPYSIFTPLLRGWERDFTVVQWDRRGVGKTLGRTGVGAAGTTLQQLTADGIEVAEFLCRHLRQPKIIALAGSMGTLVGLPMVKQRPDLFHAYVGTDHYVEMRRNDALSHQLTSQRVQAAGNARAIAAMAGIDPDPARWTVSDWLVNMQWTMGTDPVTPNGAMKLVVARALTSPLHTLRDLRHLWAGFTGARDALFEQFMAYDARQVATRLDVPFFMFQGDSDVLTHTSLAREYFDEMQAPVKEFALIRDAGHFAAFLQPAQFLTELRTRVRPLAVTAATPA